MTTELNSFDQAPVGAFIESPVGARNAPVGILIVMTWIDESHNTYQTNPQWYFTDLLNWRLFSNRVFLERGIAIFPGVMLPIGSIRGQWWDIIPRGETWPPGFSFFNVGRPGNLLEYIQAFDSLRDRRVPTALVVEVDESGSMTRPQIQPTFDNFIDWERNLFPNMFIWDDGAIVLEEQWVGSLITAVRNALDNLPSPVGPLISPPIPRIGDPVPVMPIVQQERELRPSIFLVGKNHVATGLGGGRDRVDIAKPPGVRAGHVMLASRTGIPFQVQDFIMPGEPVGWTRISRVRARGDQQWYGDLYLRVAEADEPSIYSFPVISTQGTSVGIVAYAGVDVVNPIDVEASGQMGPSSNQSFPIRSPSLTTTEDRERIVVFFGVDQQAPQLGEGGEDRFIDPPSGYRELYDSYNPDNFAMGADRLQDEAGFVAPVVPSISHRTAGSSAIVALRRAVA